MSTIRRYPTPLSGSHVQQAITSSVYELSDDLPDGAKGVYMQIIGDNARFTLDGTTPVASTTGFLLYDGHAPILVDLGTNADIKVTRDSGDCSLALQFVSELS